MSFPQSSAVVDESDIEAVVEVLRSGRLALGPKTEAFEAAMASYVGAAHAIAVSSGTAGLHLAVVAAGVTSGDEVITSPFSFVPSANCIVYEGATPVFVDIEEETLGPDPDAIEVAATERTRAILTIDLFHQPVDSDPIRAIADRHDLVIVEDACEALGAECRGRRAGTLGDIGVFGFYPNKQLTTGEGGMIVTDRDDWAGRCRSLRNQGRDASDTWLSHSRIGYNYRMDEMSAALGASQLRRIDDLLARRAAVAKVYGERMASIDWAEAVPIAPTTTTASYFVYPIWLRADVTRREALDHLASHGIPARPYFDCIHLQKPYRERFGFREGQFPVAEAVSARSLALPVHGNMSTDDAAWVMDRLGELTR